MEGSLVQLHFSAAFGRVSHRDMLYKLKSIGVGGQFLFIVLEFLSVRRRHVHLKGKVSASVDVVSGVTMGSVSRVLFFILYTSELFRIFSNYIVGYADDTTSMQSFLDHFPVLKG